MFTVETREDLSSEKVDGIESFLGQSLSDRSTQSAIIPVARTVIPKYLIAHRQTTGRLGQCFDFKADFAFGYEAVVGHDPKSEGLLDKTSVGAMVLQLIGHNDPEALTPVTISIPSFRLISPPTPTVSTGPSISIAECIDQRPTMESLSARSGYGESHIHYLHHI